MRFICASDGCSPRVYDDFWSGNGTLSRRDDFAQLWQKINGKRAPWGSNPFVWRIEFRRVEVHRG